MYGQRALFCVSWLLSTVAALNNNEVFTEHLDITTLPDGRVSSTFQFNIQLLGSSPRHPSTLNAEDVTQHYTLFPLALGQIIRAYAVTELHLTLNAGKWDYDTWGFPKELAVSSGAELWAWMAEGSGPSVDQRWRDLNNALAGLFCASLSSADEKRITSPSSSPLFSPEGYLPAFRDGDHKHHLRHMSLPSEHVCTENLTPFLKLLPCKGSSGLATLLNPHKLFDADWHGLGVHVTWQGAEGVQVRLTVQTVMNPLRQGNRRNDWSLKTLFGRTVARVCPVASESDITVSLPKSGSYSILPEPDSVVEGVAKYNAKAPLDVSLAFFEDFVYPSSIMSNVPISLRRVLYGMSQSHGQLSVSVTNHMALDAQIAYLETMPWLLQFYLHTLSTSIAGASQPDVISNLTYIPALPHSRPSTLHFIMKIPALSTVQLTIEVSKSFLRYTEHPPDAQRGWDLPPAVYGLFDGNLPRQYTPPLLVDPATPDFSMPYNVIIFTCSVVAFLFGSVFNLLTRRFVVLRTDKSGSPPASAEEKQEADKTDQDSR